MLDQIEITVDHIIGGLVFRLMTPMTNEELEDSIGAAKQIMERLDDSDFKIFLRLVFLRLVFFSIFTFSIFTEYDEIEDP